MLQVADGLGVSWYEASKLVLLDQYRGPDQTWTDVVDQLV